MMEFAFASEGWQINGSFDFTEGCLRVSGQKKLCHL